MTDSKFTRREFVASAITIAGAPFLLPATRAFAATQAAATPPDVLIAQFTDAGEKLGVSRVPKVVKTEAEWHKQLSREAFGVTRLGGTEYAFSGAFVFP